MIATETILNVRDLHVRIGDAHILQGVSLSVPKLGVTALLGRNGAGKTTTLRAILGLVPRSGTVELGAVDVSRMPTHEIVRKGVGYVPEEREVFAGLTVTENLHLAVRERNARYDLVYKLFPELKERGAQRAGSLSGGQQQMLAIARALLNRNQLLLVDEPTKGLSPLMLKAATNALRHAAEECAVLLVEQNLAVARELAASAIVINEGAVAYRGAVADLLADPDLLERLLGVRGRQSH
ncbi:MAG: ABC transporter ATP-binding protein [Candidatus Dormibacteraceae bacterium]